ncbi:MAG: NAD(P)H-hydrate dehydratase [Brumimicrobium sp.]|nr:NAD(P)H-hydrate dehydratase [Brumimicrobium sp.]
MKILSAEQQGILDNYTIENEPVSSTDLMERAARRCFRKIKESCSRDTVFSVFCGPGNNGGDGLVIARYLIENDYRVHCFVAQFTDNFSQDFKVNLERLQRMGQEIKFLKDTADLQAVTINSSVVIDAIFGTGLSRPAEGFVKNIIQFINENARYILSVDVPSGMYCEGIHESEDAIIQANETITFHAPKLNFFFPETGNYVGKLSVLDIGLLAEKDKDFEVKHIFLTKEYVRGLIKKRQRFSHKGTYGHAQLIAGSYGKMGACVLAVKAALRSGAGLVSALVPECGLEILQNSVPAAMVDVNDGKNYLSGKADVNVDRYYGVGTGMGTSAETAIFLKDIVEHVRNPLVIDADALNILAESPELLAELPENSILTPHPREFQRLVGKFKNSYERLEKQQEFSSKHKLIVVLKDAVTIISAPEGFCYFSDFGNPGMATGGAGDVLTGIITGLLAQGYTPENAAKIGVALHGMAGTRVVEVLTEEALIAEDIVDYLGRVRF